MTVVTISRQMGSMGLEVGQAAARRLNYRMVCREVINQAALQAGVPEAALAAIDELGLLGLKLKREETARYLAAVHAIVTDLAGAGNVVIVGRAGQVILRGRAGVVHVRVIAPLELRIERIMEWKKVNRETAGRLVQHSDRARAAYLRKNYQTRVDDPGLYDVVISTGRLSLDQAAELVCALCEAG